VLMGARRTDSHLRLRGKLIEMRVVGNFVLRTTEKESDPHTYSRFNSASSPHTQYINHTLRPHLPMSGDHRSKIYQHSRCRHRKTGGARDSDSSNGEKVYFVVAKIPF
jgi:hypothetical protein